MASKTSLTYRDAGVDIDAGKRFVEAVKTLVAKTRRPEVLSGPGGFAALFELPVDRFRRPVLVSGTDGVGTKIKLAVAHDCHRSIGIDLVAMCVNDVVVQGAEPLFFLDYFATGHLDPAVAEDVVAGIADGCLEAGAALVGGETAEMPGVYSGGDYDLAGFCVGIAEKEAIIDGSTIADGDVLIGMPSTGPHANGYSLIRKILEVSKADVLSNLEGRSILDHLLEPTRIYVRPLLDLLEKIPVRGFAHITGGGLIDNVPRILPPGLGAVIDVSAWRTPPIFDWLRSEGNIDENEMLRTFNCGIGMVACVREEDADPALKKLGHRELAATVIGHVEKADERRVRLT